jgi:hypothetical protein
MAVSEKQKSREQRMSLDVVWRNPLSHVQASPRSRRAGNPYCCGAEQASKIRARRSNWDANQYSVKSAIRFHLQEGSWKGRL